MTTVLYWAGTYALSCFAIALGIATIQLLRGPTPQDRILALDTMYINGMLIILVLGVQYQTGLYFDIAVIISIFGFVSSTAMAKFLLRGEVIEP